MNGLCLLISNKLQPLIHMFFHKDSIELREAFVLPVYITSTKWVGTAILLDAKCSLFTSVFTPLHSFSISTNSESFSKFISIPMPWLYDAARSTKEYNTLCSAPIFMNRIASTGSIGASYYENRQNNPAEYEALPSIRVSICHDGIEKYKCFLHLFPYFPKPFKRTAPSTKRFQSLRCPPICSCNFRSSERTISGTNSWFTTDTRLSSAWLSPVFALTCRIYK